MAHPPLPPPPPPPSPRCSFESFATLGDTSQLDLEAQTARFGDRGSVELLPLRRVALTPISSSSTGSVSGASTLAPSIKVINVPPRAHIATSSPQNEKDVVITIAPTTRDHPLPSPTPPPSPSSPPSPSPATNTNDLPPLPTCYTAFDRICAILTLTLCILAFFLFWIGGAVFMGLSWKPGRPAWYREIAQGFLGCAAMFTCGFAYALIGVWGRL